MVSFFYLFSLPSYVTFLSFFYNNGARDSFSNVYRFRSLSRALAEFFPTSRYFYFPRHTRTYSRSFFRLFEQAPAVTQPVIHCRVFVAKFAFRLHSFFRRKHFKFITRRIIYDQLLFALLSVLISFSICSPFLFFFIFFSFYFSLSISRFTFSFAPFFISCARQYASRYAIVRQRHPREI